MNEEPLDYHRMVQHALRGVMREALEVAAEEGLPGDHHFYVSFRSQAPGVVVPSFLRDRYPEEVTVVIQHQYWELDIDDDGFGVTLAFDASRQRVAVPWEAVTAFIDPVAEFALRFQTVEEARAQAERAGDEQEGDAAPGSPDATADVVNIRQFRKKDD